MELHLLQRCRLCRRNGFADFKIKNEYGTDWEEMIDDEREITIT
jgi:predicted transcriptional regulator with HTH domain